MDFETRMGIGGIDFASALSYVSPHFRCALLVAYVCKSSTEMLPNPLRPLFIIGIDIQPRSGIGIPTVPNSCIRHALDGKVDKDLVFSPATIFSTRPCRLDSTRCMGSNNHPVGIELAKRPKPVRPVSGKRSKLVRLASRRRSQPARLDSGTNSKPVRLDKPSVQMNSELT